MARSHYIALFVVTLLMTLLSQTNASSTTAYCDLLRDIIRNAKQSGIQARQQDHVVIARAQGKLPGSFLRSHHVSASSAAQLSQRQTTPTIYGLSDPQQNILFSSSNATSFPNGDVYLFNNASITIDTASATLNITGNIYLSDNSQFIIKTNSIVNWPQTYDGEYAVTIMNMSSLIIEADTFISTTSSSTSFQNARLNLIQCGSSNITITSANISYGANGGRLNLVTQELATVLMANVTSSLIEVTLSESSSCCLNDISSSVGLYYSLNGTYSTAIRVIPDPMLTQNFSLSDDKGNTIVSNITSSNVAFGFWVYENTKASFNQTIAPLFIRLGEDTKQQYNNYSINDLNPGIFGAVEPAYLDILNISTISLNLSTTIVPFINLYLSGSELLGQTNSWYVSNSSLGETVCESFNGLCYYYNVTIDGSGGWVSASTQSTAKFDRCVIETYSLAQQNSTIIYYRSEFVLNPQIVSQQLQAIDTSLIILEQSNIWDDVTEQTIFPILLQDNAIAIINNPNPIISAEICESINVEGQIAVLSATALHSRLSGNLTFSLTNNPSSWLTSIASSLMLNPPDTWPLSGTGVAAGIYTLTTTIDYLGHHSEITSLLFVSQGGIITLSYQCPTGSSMTPVLTPTQFTQSSSSTQASTSSSSSSSSASSSPSATSSSSSSTSSSSSSSSSAPSSSSSSAPSSSSSSTTSATSSSPSTQSSDAIMILASSLLFAILLLL